MIKPKLKTINASKIFDVGAALEMELTNQVNTEEAEYHSNQTKGTKKVDTYKKDIKPKPSSVKVKEELS